MANSAVLNESEVIMEQEVLDQKVQQIRDYVLDEDLDELIQKQNAKEMTNTMKAVETLLKAKSQGEELELNNRKFEFEKEQEKRQLENEKLKLENEKLKLENERIKQDNLLKIEETKLENEKLKLENDKQKLNDNLDIEKQKLEVERQRNQAQHEIDKQKIETEKEKNRIEQQRVENEKAATEATIKDQKKAFWTKIAEIVVAVLGTVAGIFLTIWMVVSTMKFEETNTARTSVGKFAMSFCSKWLTKLGMSKT